MSKARETVETLRTVLVDGDVTNANFTGADLEIAKGGTGASSAGAARTALGLVVGTDVLAPDGNGSSLTGITDTTYSVGDGGLTQVNFTTADNTKLDGIAASANNYTLPSTLPASMLTGALPAISGANLTNLPASGFTPLFDKALFGGI